MTENKTAPLGTRQTPQQNLYAPRNLNPAFSLGYDWTGWPTAGTMLPPSIADIARLTASIWQNDSLQLLELRALRAMIQILFSVTPMVSPVFFCQRVKGRLQHALRQAGTPVDFSRKVSFRSLGENTSEIVENYIRGQVGKERFADPRFAEIMKQFTVICKEVDLTAPTATNSGRYWYNLHLVLVVAQRFRITNTEKLGQLRDAVFAVATQKDCHVAALAVMPDHLHAALRGNIQMSPAEIAISFQNGLAKAAGCRVWKEGFYVGTFSEYDLDVVRRIAGAW